VHTSHCERGLGKEVGGGRRCIGRNAHRIWDVAHEAFLSSFYLFYITALVTDITWALDGWFIRSIQFFSLHKPDLVVRVVSLITLHRSPRLKPRGTYRSMIHSPRTYLPSSSATSLTFSSRPPHSPVTNTHSHTSRSHP